MKTLIVEHFLPDSIYTYELARELKQYTDLSVFCKKSAAVEEDGVRFIRKFYPDGKGKIEAVLDYGMSLVRLGKEIRNGGYDIVHVQGFKSAGFEIPLYYRTRKYYKKLVHTVHNLLPHEVSEKDQKLYTEFYQFCDALIVHNEACRKQLIQRFGIRPEKISVIAHGAYHTHPPTPPKMKTEGSLSVLQFGYIRRYKGVDILLQAIKKIPEDARKKVRVTIAGKQYPKLDGTDYRRMISDFGLEDCVTFLPKRIEEEAVGELFSSADIAVFPYREIYASGALLMAYTYEKPVLVSDIPVLAEETDQGRTGLLFQSEDPDSLADAILQALAWNEEDVRIRREAIRELTVQKYNWKYSAQKTAQTYRQTLKK